MGVGFSDAGARTWANVEYEHVRGEGQVAPRLLFDLEARTTSEQFEVEIHALKVRAYLEREYLGEGDVPFTPIGPHGRSLSVAVPVSRAALAIVTRREMGDAITLDLEFEGVMRVRLGSSQLSASAASPPPGEWTFLSIGRTQRLS